MNPIAFLLLLLLPTIGANRPILPGTLSFDGATDGTFLVHVGYALSTPLLLKNQQIINLYGGSRSWPLNKKVSEKVYSMLHYLTNQRKTDEW